MERGPLLVEEDASSVGSEKVLIEKDGVFELVSTSEVHADESASKIDANDDRQALMTHRPITTQPNRI